MQDTLLLVDGNREKLRVLSENLGEDYLIFTAENGQQALDMVERHSVRMIISDSHTPLVNGLDLCTRLKTSLNYSHIPFILLTAPNRLQSKLDALKAGADACIEQPFTPEHLKVQISNLLNNRKKIRAYYTRYPLAPMSTMVHSRTDEDFLITLNKLMMEHMENPELDVELLAKLMNTSVPTLYRKIKTLSDLTPNELLTVTRMKKAAELLAGTGYKIFEVAIMVGFNSQSSFGKAFLKQFNMTPTAFQQLKKEERFSASKFML
ncbi:response regulator transcription factor [Chitinophaga filiformis]|uniref:Response regulator transcription factor n=1 Tax=Chitinophaga filiformis TaxID=104663 RepID=A0ABY4HXI2_CHIFI|nr:response regulator transcription factor [Chitinophaga filiformis]UPK68512.1 response regulator transcription factor [Chitinophaga filiformis]